MTVTDCDSESDRRIVAGPGLKLSWACCLDSLASPPGWVLSGMLWQFKFLEVGLDAP